MTAARGEAASALLLATGITTGIAAMSIFGACWILNITTLDDFARRLNKWSGVDKTVLENLDNASDEITDASTQEFERQIEEYFGDKK